MSATLRHQARPGLAGGIDDAWAEALDDFEVPTGRRAAPVLVR